MEYHKIETLYERDEKTFKLKEPLVLKNPVYGMLRTWIFTEKIDGTNIRLIWDPIEKTIRIGGKTDNAQIHAELIDVLRGLLSPEKMAEVFPDSEVVIYGEGYGAGIQKGGDYSPTKRFIAFDVLVGGKWWLGHDNVNDVCNKLDIPTVPFIGEMSLEEAAHMVRAGFPSRLNGGKMKAEGLVGRPIETLFDKKGSRLIVKLKTKDFA